MLTTAVFRLRVPGHHAAGMQVWLVRAGSNALLTSPHGAGNRQPVSAAGCSYNRLFYQISAASSGATVYGCSEPNRLRNLVAVLRELLAVNALAKGVLAFCVAIRTGCNDMIEGVIPAANRVERRGQQYRSDVMKPRHRVADRK